MEEGSKEVSIDDGSRLGSEEGRSIGSSAEGCKEGSVEHKEVICIDSSSDEEDDDKDDDSIIKEETYAQSNLKRDQDFEYFLVKSHDGSEKIVHIVKKHDTTFLDMRNAVNSQVDPRCGQYIFHIPDRNLDICHRQELYEIKRFLKQGSGTLDDPFLKIAIKKFT